MMKIVWNQAGVPDVQMQKLMFALYVFCWPILLSDQ